jgi:sRNA-binding carbon storage regulator CsrA
VRWIQTSVDHRHRITDEVSVLIVRVWGRNVKLGFEALPSVEIFRRELLNATDFNEQ